MMNDGHDELTYLDPGWPDRERRRIMSELRANDWTDEGIARIFKVTPFTVQLTLQPGTCGVCEKPHFNCSRQDWRKAAPLATR
jgi:hypothetical protein